MTRFGIVRGTALAGPGELAGVALVGGGGPRTGTGSLGNRVPTRDRSGRTGAAACGGGGGEASTLVGPEWRNGRAQIEFSEIGLVGLATQ